LSITGSAAIAILGALRYKLGTHLLKLFILLNSKKSAPMLFVSGWTFIWATRWLFKGKEDYGNRYRISWRNFAYMQLLSGVKKIDPSFVPPLRVMTDDVLTRLVGQGHLLVIATIHARLVSSLNKMLEDLGIASSIIAISEETRRVSKLFGLKGMVDIIPLDNDSLLVARQKLKAGRLVCCCADFTVRRSGTLYHDRYIAEGLFAFAVKSRARVVYALPNVTDRGEVVITVAPPTISETGSSPHDLATDFIRFIGGVQEERPDWSVGSWALRASSPHKQYDNFWVRPLGQAKEGWLGH
jgi:hypothetical protein